jgi:hypothetical protein
MIAMIAMIDKLSTIDHARADRLVRSLAARLHSRA